ncbi:MAG: helix-turn-helix domain-containing protein [Lentisphaerae bacterium]|nr:helix-turn-helix domain-containing protein [Lentisphaerota bacterium]
MIQSLSKCMDILNHVGSCSAGAKIADLCKALNLKYPTVYNLVQSLISVQLLERTEDGVLKLGVGSTVLHHQRLNNALRDAIRQKMLLINEHYPNSILTFSQYSAGRILGVFFIEETGSHVRDCDSIFKIYQTVSGVAHAAFLPKKQAQELLSCNQFAENDAEMWGDFKVEDSIAICRKNGYAILPWEKRERIGIPLFYDRQFFGVLTWAGKNISDSDWKLMLKKVPELSFVELENFRIKNETQTA